MTAASRPAGMHTGSARGPEQALQFVPSVDRRLRRAKPRTSWTSPSAKTPRKRVFQKSCVGVYLCPLYPSPVLGAFAGVVCGVAASRIAGRIAARRELEREMRVLTEDAPN